MASYRQSDTAIYNGGGGLVSVSFPDGRREDFAYADGLLASITEVGVDGSTSRSWSYTGVDDKLARIDRPDGTALAYRDDDPSNPVT